MLGENVDIILKTNAEDVVHVRGGLEGLGQCAAAAESSLGHEERDAMHKFATGGCTHLHAGQSVGIAFRVNETKVVAGFSRKLDLIETAGEIMTGGVLAVPDEGL
jgi:hypothetical protein